jgi:S-adenosylmethionine/arginine decarboxylase-like enzyme
MTPVHKATKYQYPVEGKGGVGFTIFQPITESFMALDAWPDHDGAYLFICSCKDFDKEKVVEYLVRKEMFKVIEASESGLHL